MSRVSTARIVTQMPSPAVPACECAAQSQFRNDQASSEPAALADRMHLGNPAAGECAFTSSLKSSRSGAVKELLFTPERERSHRNRLVTDLEENQGE